MNIKILFRIFSSTLLLFLLLLSVVVVDGFNITRGSSISTNSPNTTYWLSPSGNIAFGFYPLCSNPPCSQFIVGIWIIKSADKTLVWTANRNNPPLNHTTSILFNNDGKLVLQTADGREKPLLRDMWESASYAAMLDNGNFVLYSSNSTIIWESFDYPTNTILGGQTLKGGQSLISNSSTLDPSYGNYELWIKQYNRNDIAICDMEWDSEYHARVNYDSSNCDRNRDKDVSPITMILDSTTGRLYMVNWDNNLVLINITKGENHPKQQQQQQHNNGSQVDTNNVVVIYRATLDMDGIFRLYKEIIANDDSDKSIVLWDSMIRPDEGVDFALIFVLILFGVPIGLLAFCFVIAPFVFCIEWCLDKRRKTIKSDENFVPSTVSRDQV